MSAELTDPALRRRLIRYTQDRLRSRAYHLRLEAEDVVQTAYVKTWNAMQRGTYEENGTLQAYIITIIDNDITSRLRIKKRAGFLPSLITQPNQYENSLLHEVVGDLRHMKGRQPNMFAALRDTLEGGHERIANQQGLSIGTVKSRAFRGHKQIRAKYGSLDAE